MSAALKELMRLLEHWGVSAYRQLPNMPEEYAGLVEAFWHPACSDLRFAVLKAHPYGLASAVLNFNRLPCLATAFLLRALGACAKYFFYDSGVLDVSSSHGSAQEAVVLVYSAMGAILDVAEQQPMAQQRLLLGVLLNLFPAIPQRHMIADVRPGLREAIFHEVQHLSQAGSRTSDDLHAALLYVQALVTVVSARVVPLVSLRAKPLIVCLIPVSGQAWAMSWCRRRRDHPASLHNCRTKFLLCSRTVPHRLPLLRLSRF